MAEDFCLQDNAFTENILRTTLNGVFSFHSLSRAIGRKSLTRPPTLRTRTADYTRMHKIAPSRVIWPGRRCLSNNDACFLQLLSLLLNSWTHPLWRISRNVPPSFSRSISLNSPVVQEGTYFIMVMVLLRRSSRYTETSIYGNYVQNLWENEICVHYFSIVGTKFILRLLTR